MPVSKQASLLGALLCFVLLALQPLNAAAETEAANEKFWFNGKLRMYEPIVDGQREGIARYYYPNGRLYAEIPYEEDMKEGRFTIHRPDGTIAEEQEWHNDLLNGEVRKFHRNGRVAESSYFVDGDRSGPAVWFDEQGHIVATGVYQEGALVAGAGTGSLATIKPALSRPAGNVKPQPDPMTALTTSTVAATGPMDIFESLKEHGILRVAMPIMFLIGLGCVVYATRMVRRESLILDGKIHRDTRHWQPEPELLSPVRRASLVPESFPVLFAFLLPLMLSFALIAVYRNTWGFIAAVAVGLLGSLGLYASLAARREREKALIEAGVPVAARLVPKDPEAENPGSFVLAYSWDGADYLLDPNLSRMDHPYKAGDVVTVLIDPRNPTVCQPYQASRFEAFPL